ncbi:MAG: 50S ribosomal protein L24 [Acidobacteria bacterium]|nr:50S ribosomal protein L24 [Acidobacteriota bacterium]
MLRIKKNDTVKVIAGKNRGKTGRVLSVEEERNRLVVEHVQMVKRHVRPNPSRGIKGGIVEQESPIHISNVMMVCPSCGPVRIRAQVLPEGRKVRACRKCGNTFE